MRTLQILYNAEVGGFSRCPKDYKLGIMLNLTDYARKFDFRAFGDQFFIRKSDSLEVKNQINNDLYAGEIEALRKLYKKFTNEVPDIGKQEIIQNIK